MNKYKSRKYRLHFFTQTQVWLLLKSTLHFYLQTYSTCSPQQLTTTVRPHVFFLYHQCIFFSIAAALISPLLGLSLCPLQLLSMFYTLSDVFLLSNGVLDNHDRNIAPCGIICRGAMGATVFWVCHKWNNKEWWGWFVLLVHLIVEAFEEPSRDLALLL